MRNCFFLVILTAGLLPLLQAQERMYRNFTVQDGLPSNNIYSSFQDSKGYIWFCTDAGVSRFDGRHFTNFTIRDGLPGNEIFSCQETSDGKIVFLSHQKSLSYYEDGRFYNINQEKWLLTKPVTADLLAVDRQGNTFYNTSDNEYSFQVNFAKRYSALRRNGKDSFFVWVSLPGGTVDTIYGGMYLWLRNEMVRVLKTASASWTHLNTPQAVEKFFNIIGAWPAAFRTRPCIRIFFDLLRNQSDFVKMRIFRWVSLFNNGGMAVYSFEGGTFYYPQLPFHKEEPEIFQPSHSPSLLMKDREGNFWVSTTSSGVFLYQNHSASSYAGFIPGKSVYSLALSGNRLAIGQNDRAGLLLQNAYSVFWSGMPSAEKKQYRGINNRVKCMLANGDKGMLLGCDFGMLYVDMRTGRSRHLLIDEFPDGKIVVPAVKNITRSRSGLFYYAYNSGIGTINLDNNARTYLATNKRFISVCEDNEGVLWAGSTDGLYKLTPGGLQAANGGLPGLQSEVSSITGLGGNGIAIATNGNGCFIVRRGVCLAIPGNGGAYFNGSDITSNICRRVVSRTDSSFWVCTNKGVNLVTVSSWQPFTYRVNYFLLRDGLLSDDINDVQEQDGKLWVATSNGLCSFWVHDMKRAPLPPDVSILNNGQVNGSILPPGGRLQIRFGAVSFAGGDVLYRYRLLGLSDQWDTTRDEQVQFVRLPPGEYEMQVYAINSYGQQSGRPAWVTFRVSKPWWWQTEYIALFAAGLLALLYLGYRQVAAVARRREKKKQEHLNQLQQLEMKALRSQMNPHFIFNSMNSVQKYILANDTEAACRYVSSFSSLIRQVLENARQATVTLQNEMALLEAYMQLEQQRFKKKFQYSIQCGAGITPSAVRLPPMLIQPFVENAIWHGIQNIEQEGRIAIMFTLFSDGVLLCTVEDNGAGRREYDTAHTATAKHRSLGVSITGQRLSILNGGRNNGVNIRYSRPAGGRGTRVEIFIVCNTAHDDKSDFN